jgi:hypothetical protein
MLKGFRNIGDDFSGLPAAPKDAVKDCVAKAKGESGKHAIQKDGWEAYAYASYSSEGERIHWGVDGDTKGFQPARGVLVKAN